LARDTKKGIAEKTRTTGKTPNERRPVNGMHHHISRPVTAPEACTVPLDQLVRDRKRSTHETIPLRKIPSNRKTYKRGRKILPPHRLAPGRRTFPPTGIHKEITTNPKKQARQTDDQRRSTEMV